MSTTPAEIWIAAMRDGAKVRITPCDCKTAANTVAWELIQQYRWESLLVKDRTKLTQIEATRGPGQALAYYNRLTRREDPILVLKMEVQTRPRKKSRQ